MDHVIQASGITKPPPLHLFPVRDHYRNIDTAFDGWIRLGILVWTLLYLVTKRLLNATDPLWFRSAPKRIRYNVPIKFVSFVHALVVSVYSMLCVWESHALLTAGKMPDNWMPKYVIMVSGFSFAYFVFDSFIVVIRYRAGLEPSGDGSTARRDLLQLIMHHTVCLAVSGTYFTLDRAHHLPMYFMAMEASSPFMHIRWFMADVLHVKSGKVYIANGLMFLVMFFIARVFLMLVMLWDIYIWYGATSLASMPMRPQCWIGWVVLWGLQLVWFRKIFLGAFKVLNAPKKPRKEARSAAASQPPSTRHRRSNSNGAVPGSLSPPVGAVRRRSTANAGVAPIVDAIEVSSILHSKPKAQ